MGAALSSGDDHRRSGLAPATAGDLPIFEKSELAACPNDAETKWHTGGTRSRYRDRIWLNHALRGRDAHYS
jgi:hypothetical protein